MSESTHYLASLWRYPVKSMMGEELNATVVCGTGLLGDRAYALVDQETDKIVSAKNPKKWPTLFACHARFAAPVTADTDLPAAWITLPDGKMVLSDQDDADQQMSLALNREVNLRMQAPRQASLEQYWPEYDGEQHEISQEAIAGDASEGSFFDYSPIHIITTASLTHLQTLYPAGRMEARRFRPNLVIATPADETGFVENSWVGKTLSIGSVKFQITDPCPRCVMPTLAQGDLGRDAKIMKTIAENTVHIPFAGKALPAFGVYAKVIQTGTIHRHDTVTIN